MITTNLRSAEMKSLRGCYKHDPDWSSIDQRPIRVKGQREGNDVGSESSLRSMCRPGHIFVI